MFKCGHPGGSAGLVGPSLEAAGVNMQHVHLLLNKEAFPGKQLRNSSRETLQSPAGASMTVTPVDGDDQNTTWTLFSLSLCVLLRDMSLQVLIHPGPSVSGRSSWGST